MAWYSHLSLLRRAHWWRLQQQTLSKPSAGLKSFAITSIGLGSGSGIAVGELGDATTALGVVPICIGFGLRCRIERGAFSEPPTVVELGPHTFRMSWLIRNIRMGRKLSSHTGRYSGCQYSKAKTCWASC